MGLMIPAALGAKMAAPDVPMIGIGADGARVAGVEIAATRTRPNGLGGVRQRIGERDQQGFAAFGQVKRGPSRRARPQTRQLGEELDQPVEVRMGHHGARKAAHRRAPENRGGAQGEAEIAFRTAASCRAGA